MIPFQRRRDGVHVNFADYERALLADLTAQLVTLLRDADDQDPAFSRLSPSAYAGDSEASAEFRRFTLDDLTAQKVANAEIVRATLTIDRKTALSGEQEQAWLRSLTDVRLTLATRIGVTADGYASAAADDSALYLRSVYEWLGYVQESLVQSLDR